MQNWKGPKYDDLTYTYIIELVLNALWNLTPEVVDLSVTLASGSIRLLNLSFINNPLPVMTHSALNFDSNSLDLRIFIRFRRKHGIKTQGS